jgi:hypothetical protein
MSFPGNRLRRVLRCALLLLATSLAFAARAAEAAHTFGKPDAGRIVYLQPTIDPDDRYAQFDPEGDVLLDAPAMANSPTQVAHSEPLPEFVPSQALVPENASPPIDVPAEAIEVAPDGLDTPAYGPEEFEPYDFSENYAAPNDFTWQVAPSGLIYRSYLAGPLEPRTGITPFFSDNHTFWDAMVGGRGGVLRYGDCDPLHPQGWQLDVYGAAITRLDAEFDQDLVSADFVFGFPITYGVGNWQFKTGYAHLSSHLGDEYAMRYPDALDDRINYVRDSIVFGSSWYPVPACRVYGELDWAIINVSGGAEPIAFQFGTELSRPGPTGLHGSPFFAINGRSRQEIDFGGDVNTETGWLWRGVTGKVFRIGAHYYTGHSSQSQFYKNSEEQIGIGLWYDF